MKRLVICCDGTWNRADQEQDEQPVPTNVVRFAYRVAKRDAATTQVVFYDQGVGTGNRLDQLTGGAFGVGLEDNLYEAYRFLIANYELGDELFILGFSRGAFTARSLAGLIRNSGILRRDRVDLYRDAINQYRNRGKHPSGDLARHFRLQHAMSVEGCPDVITPIKFLGVWDTVGALGIPVDFLNARNRQAYEFHDTDLSGSVEHAYHALAIDEHRKPFEPTLWTNAPKHLYNIDGTQSTAL